MMYGSPIHSINIKNSFLSFTLSQLTWYQIANPRVSCSSSAAHHAGGPPVVHRSYSQVLVSALSVDAVTIADLPDGSCSSAFIKKTSLSKLCCSSAAHHQEDEIFFSSAASFQDDSVPPDFAVQFSFSHAIFFVY